VTQFASAHAGVSRTQLSGADQLLHLHECGLGKRLHLGVGAILDGVRHVQAVRVKTQCSALSVSRRTKHFGSDEAPGDAATIQFSYVMQTARRTRTSVGQRLHNHVALGRNFL
jgi:hypothetical protein